MVLGRPRHWFRELRQPGRALLALALFAVIAAAVYFSAKSLGANKHFQAAQEALEKDDLAQAKVHLRKSLEVRPDHPEAYLLLARIARRMDSHEEAEYFLARCERLGGVPQAIELESVLSRVQQGDLARQESFLWACVDKDHPDSVLILEALARGYFQSYRLSQALQAANHWLKRQPDSRRALIFRGKLFVYRKDLAEAMQDFQRAVDLDGADLDARLLLANALNQLARPREALEQFEYLRRHDPDNLAVLLGLAKSHLGAGQVDEARALLDGLLASAPKHQEALTVRGKLELEAAQPARAEKYLRQAVDVGPFERHAVYNLAQCLQQLGNKREAEELFARLRRIDADLKRMREITQSLQEKPHDASLRCEAGTIFLGIGKDEEALAWFHSALKEEAHHRPTHQALAKYHREKGRLDLAARHEEALKKK